MSAKHKLVTCLWFDGNGEEAARYYTSIFKDSKLGPITRHGDAGPGPKGSVLTVEFQLEGRDFVALNGGPNFKFNEAISHQILCDTQDDIDYFWRKLSTGGEEGPCGWLKDKFGVSWQVVPTILLKLLQDPDAAKANRAMQAMMKMGKLDIAKLEAAARG